MIEVQIVIFIPWKNVGVEVPDILVAIWFIVLACRRTCAILVRTAKGDCHLFDSCIHFAERFVVNIVQALKVSVRDHNDMARIVYPPFRCYECRYILVLVHDIVILLVLCLIACEPITKGAYIVGGLV